MNNIKATIIDDCFKSISNFGTTVYQNICTGEAVSVPWGTLDWAFLTLISILLLLVIFLIGYLFLEEIIR